MTSPYDVRTPSGANGARTRAGGWFPVVVARARSAGLVVLMLGLVALVGGVSPAYTDGIVKGQDAGKRSNVTPSKGKGNGSGDVARLTGARADHGTDCTKGSGDTKIRGCSGIIESRRLFGKPISKGNLASVYYNRGIAFKNKGRYNRAITDFTKAIKLNSKHAYGYHNRGITYSDKGDYNRAIADYDKAIGLNPKYASAYCNRGVAYGDKGDYDRAIADYHTAIKLLDPKDAHSYHFRGNIFEALDRKDEAIADFRKALELDPSDEDHKENLNVAASLQDYSALLTETGRGSEAVKLEARAKKMRTKHPESTAQQRGFFDRLFGR